MELLSPLLKSLPIEPAARGRIFLHKQGSKEGKFAFRRTSARAGVRPGVNGYYVDIYCANYVVMKYQ
jgi:hypothetical protein